MRSLPGLKHPPAVLLSVCWLLAGAAQAHGSIAIGGPLRARILFDNSGSMYPGYRPDISRGKHDMPFFYQIPEFQSWLSDFVAAQTILDVSTVDMWTFTTNGEFKPSDLQQVHAEVPVTQFQVEAAIPRIPHFGQNTNLAESLSQCAQGFEGLIWLITDNIVETRERRLDADVAHFFQVLHEDPRFVSVHLFKYPVVHTGKQSALAIYGILVSPQRVARPVLAYYDRKLRSTFRFANGRRGDPPPPLFPGREHLKLRDLSVDALELQAVPNLEVRLDDSRRDLVAEGQHVLIAIQGRVQSYLTQHSVIHGHYRLEVGDLEPDDQAKRELGAQRIPASSFPAVEGDILEAIPPNGTRDVSATLRSTVPVSLSGGGLGAWLEMALHGATVKYTGDLRMTFTDVRVRPESEPMTGIFGVEQAPAIFGFPTVADLDVAPSDAPIKFELRTGASRAAILLLVLASLAALAALAAAFLLRPAWYTLRISGSPDRLVSLRRLGGLEVVHEGQSLGHLRRGVAGEHAFSPNVGDATFTVAPSRQADSWDFHFRDGHGCQLTVIPKLPAGNRAAPPGSTAPPDRAPLAGEPRPGVSSPARALPKIDRP